MKQLHEGHGIVPPPEGNPNEMHPGDAWCNSSCRRRTFHSLRLTPMGLRRGVSLLPPDEEEDWAEEAMTIQQGKAVGRALEKADPERRSTHKRSRDDEEPQPAAWTE